MRSQRLTTMIFVAMVLGILAGWACHEAFPDPQTAATIAGYISLITDLFLRLIKMIIAPLVISTLIVGITHMGDTGPWAGSAPRPWAGSCPPRWSRCSSA